MLVIKKVRKLFDNSNGQVAVIAAILIVAIVGMTALVVDMGSLYEDRRSLQGTADAAALAGAQELPESRADATQEAIDNIEKNYQDDNNNLSVSIEFDSFMGVPDAMITATVSNPDSPIRFGRVYGSSSADISATATAVVGSPEDYSDWVVPWGLIEGEYATGTSYTLKYGAPPENSPGNFGALAIDGSGSNTYESTIINGSQTPINIGDLVDTQTGNMTGKTKSGVGGRIARQPDGVWTDASDLYTYDSESGEILAIYDTQFVLIPIISHWPPGSSEEVEILDFEIFIIEEPPENIPGGKCKVEGVFLEEALVVWDGGINAVDQTGIRIVRLIK